VSEHNAPAVKLPEHTRAAIQAALRECKERILAELHSADKVLEAEVIAIGAAVDDVVTQARGYLGEMEEVIAGFGAYDPNNPLSKAIDQQVSLSSTYQEEMAGYILAQDRRATQALEQCTNIAAAGDSINELVRTSKMLALNAMIEASRLGEHGRAFMVIAKEMKQLSETVDKANQQVSALVKILLVLLPDISAQTSTMKGCSTQFSGALGRCMDNLREARAQMEAGIKTSLQRGDARLERILASSRDALSHLQFQDPTVQSLRRMEMFLMRLEQHLAGLLALEQVQQDAVFMVNLGDQVSAEESIDLDAGELLLF
jgi:hypothetical protein